jgi:hypothetical protein
LSKELYIEIPGPTTVAMIVTVAAITRLAAAGLERDNPDLGE